ncbi:hypothetical protein FRX31_027659 [Thalictrum thalictroides]|uniref:Uncharacterized protein n=1 Tax=Thalictrum thalictroides TaxID=46969 RepID=A0A7J6VCC8_THATH|nr:hypothetical protein FRX31_027659 [Thalictrum thalictroides]
MLLKPCVGVQQRGKLCLLEIKTVRSTNGFKQSSEARQGLSTAATKREEGKGIYKQRVGSQ